MAGQLTINEKTRIVRLYSVNGESSTRTREMMYRDGVAAGKWDKIGVDRAPIPSRQTIENINKLFDDTGCVEKHMLKSLKRQKEKGVSTAENLQRVREEVLKSPNVSKSHRRLSATLGISPSSVYTILKELKRKPYIQNLFNEKFPGTWIGRRGSIEWPARSPDLSPLVFFFWGVMKDRVYTEKFKSLEDLKKIIKREALIIANDKELLKKVCSSVTGRVAECIDANGGPFEQNR